MLSSGLALIPQLPLSILGEGEQNLFNFFKPLFQVHPIGGHGGWERDLK
jgi:hypothetical protein